jgi:hypothetical protein
MFLFPDASRVFGKRNFQKWSSTRFTENELFRRFALNEINISTDAADAEKLLNLLNEYRDCFAQNLKGCTLRIFRGNARENHAITSHERATPGGGISSGRSLRLTITNMKIREYY